MTLTFGRIMNDVDYVDGGATGAVVASDLNQLRNNAEIAWSIAVAQMSRTIKPADGYDIAPPEHDSNSGFLFTHAYSLPVLSAAQCMIGVTGSAILTASTGGPSNSTVICRDHYNSRWRVFSRNATTSLYSSAADNLVSLSATTSANSHSTTGATYIAGIPSGPRYVIACGAASGNAIVAAYSGTTQSVFASNTNSYKFDAIASSYANAGTRVVAVGAGCCSYSSDCGATWTHTTLPALPATAVGVLSLAYSPTLNQFICSGLLSSGYMFWSTSATGASWQAWRRTDVVSMNSTIATLSVLQTLGIAEINGTWVAPHVTGTSGYQIGIVASFDYGASWRVIPGGARFGGLNYLKAIPCGDRIAIASNDSIAITGPVGASNRVNSVSA